LRSVDISTQRSGGKRFSPDAPACGRIPGGFAIGDRQVAAADVDERLVAPAYQRAQRNALPNLVRFGALVEN